MTDWSSVRLGILQHVSTDYWDFKRYQNEKDVLYLQEQGDSHNDKGAHKSRAGLRRLQPVTSCTLIAALSVRCSGGNEMLQPNKLMRSIQGEG